MNNLFRLQILKSFFQWHLSPEGSTYAFHILSPSRELHFSSGPLRKDNFYCLYCTEQASILLCFVVCAPHTLPGKLELPNQYLLTCEIFRCVTRDMEEGALVKSWNAIPSKLGDRHSSDCVNKTNQGDLENKGNVTLQSLALLYLLLLKVIVKNVPEIICRYLGGKGQNCSQLESYWYWCLSSMANLSESRYKCPPELRFWQ